MIISILLLIILIAVLFFYNIYSKISVMFIVQLGGLCLIITSLIMFTMKLSYYSGIFGIETWIYYLMRKIEININDVKLWMIIGYFLIFISQTFIMWEFSKKGKRAKTLFCVSLFFALGFAIINSNMISEIVYIKAFERLSYNQSQMINDVLTYFNYALITCFAILPFWSLVSNIKNTRIILKKRRGMIITVFLVFVEFIVVLFSFYSRLRNMLVFYMINMIDTYTNTIGELSVIVPIISVGALVVMAFIIVKFDVFNTIDFFKPYVARSNMKVLLMDLKYIFHDFKNFMMTIIALQNTALDDYGSEDGKKALVKIGDFAYSYAQKVGDLLDIYKSKKITFKEVDLLTLIYDASARIKAESNVEINILNNVYENTSISGDEYQLNILFYNLLKNAVDAVKAKNIPDGRIDINFIEEDKWLCVDLTDNGIGMSRKETKKIWKPFVSSKKTFMNWGIGLSQVRNIIEAHLGYIDIMSKKNEYTKIQLVFQRN